MNKTTSDRTESPKPTVRTSDTPVRDLAFKLKSAIKAHGGAKAIWEQLDPRFKASEDAPLEGLKINDKTRITWDAFEKAVERLDRQQATYENMSFGIKGNPILLMNVFQALGINGFADLSDVLFEAPDPIAQLTSINGKINELSEQMEKLSDDVDVFYKKQPRLTALKVAADFEQITMRLSAILENNNDTFIDMATFEVIRKQLENIQLRKDDEKSNAKLIQNIINNAKLLTLQSRANKYYDRLVQRYISSYSNEDKQVLYFFNILMEYKEYCFYHQFLRKYYRILIHKKNFIGDFKDWRHANEYKLSPLYLSLFYLIAASQYIDKISVKAENIRDETIRARIAKFKEGISSIKYLSLITNNLIKQIAKIFKSIENKKGSVHAGLYEVYKKVLENIIRVYHNVLIDVEEPSPEEINQAAMSIRNLYDLHSMKLLSVNGRYNLTHGIMNDFDILMNEVSLLARNTLRDING
ncbi:hypothetical protein AGMMS49546_28290 [Spirochaetia bacterium]|nr:hypothetical protein AGMMS49546_28290 [Spirochaetia bacterium]